MEGKTYKTGKSFRFEEKLNIITEKSESPIKGQETSLFDIEKTTLNKLKVKFLEH